MNAEEQVGEIPAQRIVLSGLLGAFRDTHPRDFESLMARLAQVERRLAQTNTDGEIIRSLRDLLAPFRPPGAPLTS